MKKTVLRGVTTVSVVALLAGCQAFPAVQQDIASIGNRSSATSFPGFGGGGSGSAATTSSGTQLVTDPYAGQGVAQPNVPGGGATSQSNASAPQTTTTPARTHTVAAGETGWSISRKYGITPQDLAAANTLDAALTIKVGQKLTIPAATVTRVSDASAPGQGTPTPTPPSASQPLPDEKTAPTSAPVAKPATPDLGATRTAASGSGRFQMPVNGSIVRAYSKGSNDGIDLSAGSGSPVKAAASGSVAAVTRDTDGVPIVVIRHEGQLMTVYAGMGALSVQKGDQVKAGQQIGTAGNAGSIHFEVRQGYDSVDPEGYF